MLEDRMQRKIFGSQREEVIVGCKKVYNEQLHDMYCIS
jgi:hypothetical protein